jgi:hypothetical protein
MKTFEKDRQQWSSGFRGYRDNSPEAKQRRRKQRMDQMIKFGLKPSPFGLLAYLRHQGFVPVYKEK